ncbi:acyl-CoA N-acyltransferase [Microdochium bolleyi]|uniref:Acyl-CoA N-acyltransferase n=1 Tax=Microdochium bolleyi TaxID=196109 RepID=A0A136J3D6_9PEZI|nr:acyl-CoA N-acyltransferase [Microdochium bolleyi]
MRLATHSDLDAIVAVAIAALPADPVNPYRFPRWQEYPADYAKFTRIRYAGWLADPANVIMVCEVPGSDTSLNPGQQTMESRYPSPTAAGDKRIVAFGIWELPPPQRTSNGADQQGLATLLPHSTATPPSTSSDTADTITTRRDANPARVARYAAEFSRAKSHFFELPYGDTNLYLSILACHPDYQRRGIGRRLVTWGLEKASREGLDLTVFGSPMGSLLYQAVGFREVGRFRVQVDGEEESLETLAMVLKNEDIP